MNNLWLTCSRCAKRMPFALQGKCECGAALLVEYDLELASRSFTKQNLKQGPSSMWRYRDLLPVRKPEAVTSLGEGWTPLLRLYAQEKKLPLKQLWVKREEQNPTGSFKARGMTVAISLLRERGVRKAAVNSNGNAASAMAAYAGRAGMQAFVFVPRDCPGLIVEECVHYGAQTYLVDGLIHDAGKIIEDGMKEQGWATVGTLKEPGRVEGKKTMGFELAEQMDWKLPDVIVYPTGGGSGVIGMWKAFRELKALGLVDGEMPRMVSVQEQGCQPLVDAIAQSSMVKPPSGEVTSQPTGMRVPNPPDGELIVSILRETGGTAVAVSSQEIQSAQLVLGKEGISASPEGAATWAGLMRLCETGWLHGDETVVLFNTSHAMKYLPWTLSRKLPVLKDYSDFTKE